jgi:GNAT superfamily N-acetyltransferase
MPTAPSPYSRTRLSALPTPPRTPAPAPNEMSQLARRAWRLRVDSETLLIRPSSWRDLAAVAAMHGRCTPRSLLYRYRRGGRPLAVSALDNQLRGPMSFVATLRDGRVVAAAVAAPDERHGADYAEIGILVEDAWQGLGIAREVVPHVAGAAWVAGYSQLTAYPGPDSGPAQRLMVDVGRTRLVTEGGEVHLHTLLNETTSLGLGPVRERLVG